MGLIHFRCSAEGLATCSANPYLAAMERLASWSPVSELEVNSVERREPGWLVAVDSRESASCPECGTQSSSRHSSYLRTLQDLSTQGTPVTIQARVTRWRCRNEQCGRRIFAERLPTLAAPFARRTARFAGIVRLFGHSTGGRPSERLLARLGMPVSDSTILRAVKERAAAQSSRAAARVIGIDEWAWRKGMNYGTIFVVRRYAVFFQIFQRAVELAKSSCSEATWSLLTPSERSPRSAASCRCWKHRRSKAKAPRLP